MMRLTAFFFAAAMLTGCYASVEPETGEVTGELDPTLGAMVPGVEIPAVEIPVDPLVDECLATGFAWHDDLAEEPGRVLMFANYPLLSPEYELELYGMEIWVVVDEQLEERSDTTTWGGEGLEEVVFGREAGDDSWRLLNNPDAACPPLPPGRDWPTA